MLRFELKLVHVTITSFTTFLMTVHALGQGETRDPRLAPQPMKKPPAEFLYDGPAVDMEGFVPVMSPEDTILKIRQLHLKLVEELREVNGYAWTNFIYSNHDAATVILVEFAYSNKPRMTRELLKYPKKDLPSRELLRPKDFVCTIACIDTPEIQISADGFARKGIDNIEIKRQSGIVGQDRFQFAKIIFGYRETAEDFFSKLLTRLEDDTFVVEVSSKDKLIAIVQRKRGNENRRLLWVFDLSKNGSAVYSENSGSFTSTNYENKSSFWMPKTVKRIWFNRRTKTWNRHVEISFFETTPNPELENNMFSVFSLPVPSDDTRVIDRRSGRVQHFSFGEFKKAFGNQ